MAMSVTTDPLVHCSAHEGVDIDCRNLGHGRGASAADIPSEQVEAPVGVAGHLHLDSLW